MFLANGIIFLISQQQKRVHLSSTKAEYIGMMETACQIQWIWNLYKEISFILGPLPLCIDNQGAVFLASNPTQEGHTKHVQMKQPISSTHLKALPMLLTRIKKSNGGERTCGFKSLILRAVGETPRELDWSSLVVTLAVIYYS